MEFNKYKEFVSGLFNIDLLENKIGGYTFDGKKDDNPVIIFNYNIHKDSNIDDFFIEDINKHVGNRMNGGRIYIVAPSTRVDFITDYEEIDGIRYYFLKIPYQIIKKNNVNSLDESIGFSFNRTPKVNSSFDVDGEKAVLVINDFSSEEPRSAKTTEEKSLLGFDLLSAVFIDRNYNGKEFMMTDSFFLDEIKCMNEKLMIEFDKKNVGKKVMVVYTDIFGNDLTECFQFERGTSLCKR